MSQKVSKKFLLRVRKNLLYSFIVILFCIICTSIVIGAGESGSRHNRLISLRFLSQTSQLVGDCNSEPGSIRFWSLESGNLNNVIQLDDNEFSSSIAVNQDESLLAVGTFILRPARGSPVDYETVNRSG